MPTTRVRMKPIKGSQIDDFVKDKELFTLNDIIAFCKTEDLSALKSDINNHLRENYEISQSSEGRNKTFKHISIGSIDLNGEVEEHVYKILNKYIDPKITFGHEFELGSNVYGDELREHIKQYTTIDVKGDGTSYSGSSSRTDFSVFNVTYDTTAGTPNQSKGYELLTPILKGRKGLKELKLFFNSLKVLYNTRASNGHRKLDTGRGNGGHVHFGFGHMNLTDSQLGVLVKIYLNNVDLINILTADHRRDHNHSYTTTRSVDNYVSNDGSFNCNSGRTNSINTTQFRTRGTIEFRQKESTFDFYDLATWIVFVQYLAKYAKSGKPHFRTSNPIQLYKNLGMSDELLDMMRVAIVRNNKDNWRTLLPSSEVERIENALNM